MNDILNNDILVNRDEIYNKTVNENIINNNNTMINLNKNITDNLEIILKDYEYIGDKRAISYRKVIGIIKNLKFKIENVKQLDNIYGIGEKTKLKINELLKTGEMTKVEENKNND